MRGVEHAHGRLVDAVEVRQLELALGLGDHGGDLENVAADLDAERAEELLGQEPGGDPRSRLARARALEHVADVREAELVEAGQVGVARARQVRLLHLRVDRPRVHPLFPVRVVAVGDEDRHRRRPASCRA